MSEQAFKEVVVLDCSEGISGAYCTKLLADFGAIVIKIEKPGIGDTSRRMEPFLNDEPNPEKSEHSFTSIPIKKVSRLIWNPNPVKIYSSNCLKKLTSLLKILRLAKCPNWDYLMRR